MTEHDLADTGFFHCSVCDSDYPDVFRETHMQMHDEADATPREGRWMIFWLYCLMLGALAAAVVIRLT